MYITTHTNKKPNTYRSSRFGNCCMWAAVILVKVDSSNSLQVECFKHYVFSNVYFNISIYCKVGPRWVGRNYLISNSLSSFRISLYNCTTYCCLQFWFMKGFLKSGRNFNKLKMRLWSTQRGPTLAFERETVQNMLESHLCCST